MICICPALGDELTRCLPALRALTGYDTTSKESTKPAALRNVCKPENSSLIIRKWHSNGGEIFGQMLEIINSLMIFVLLHLTTVFSRWTLKKRKHNIQRAYYQQQQLWVQAPFQDASTTTNVESHGYVRSGGLLVSEIVLSQPEGLPDPSSRCGKCAHQKVCGCRIAEIKCCKYCKCEGKNPELFSWNGHYHHHLS